MKRPHALIGAALLVGGVLLSGAAGTSRSAADPAPGPAAATLRVLAESTAGRGDAVLLVQCDAPDHGAEGIDVSAATAERHTVTAAPEEPGELTLDGQEPGSDCTVTQQDPGPLSHVSGGTPVHDPAGALTGVRTVLADGVTTVGLVDDFSVGGQPAAP